MNNHKPITRKVIATIARALILLAMVASSSLAYAAEPVKIGVQAFRSKAQMLAQWQPLVAALKQSIPERDFIIEPLTNEEMESAVASRQLDFVLTNPSNYVLISKRLGLSSPLATLADEDNGREVTVFGGIIFTRAGQTGINNLKDIAGRTIAATTVEALGSYQMQAYELSLAGVRLPQDAKLLFSGSSQDNVVEAVRSGRADVGFVRTGLLESMVREGKLDMAQFKIINRQNLPGYSAALSTHLYPNWPFAALPHIDGNLSRRVAVALFRLEENTAVTHAMRIHGFVVPADYTPVEALLQELRLPPFDVASEISLRDLWTQYHWWITVGLVAAGLILLLSYRLWLSNYRLRAGIAGRKRMESQLLEREYQFRTLAENSPDVIVRYDREGRRIYVNPEFERVNQLSAQQVLGKTPAELSTELKPKADEFTEQLMAAMASGTSTKVDLSWTKDGQQICWFVRVVPEFDADGKVVSALTIWSDISERKQAEEEIKKLNSDLEQRVVTRTADLEASNKELEAFAYSVSHDLRTPLRAIDGFSGMLLEDYAGKLDDEGKRLLNVVRGNTIRMGQLIDDILKFSRTGRLEMSVSKIDMEKLARDVFTELQPSAGSALQVEIESIPPATGDSSMMRQVFVNLLTNAIKFSRTRETPRIKLGGFIEGKEAIYFVRDNGVGFDMQYAEKLFGVFQRLHGVTEFEGTGIGLAIVKRIVTRHGGRVWAEGKLNEGATICFSIPVSALNQKEAS